MIKKKGGHSARTAVQLAAYFISLMTHHEGPGRRPPAVARRDGV